MYWFSDVLYLQSDRRILNELRSSKINCGSLVCSLIKDEQLYRNLYQSWYLQIFLAWFYNGRITLDMVSTKKSPKYVFRF